MNTYSTIVFIKWELEQLHHTKIECSPTTPFSLLMINSAIVDINTVVPKYSIQMRSSEIQNVTTISTSNYIFYDPILGMFSSYKPLISYSWKLLGKF